MKAKTPAERAAFLRTFGGADTLCDHPRRTIAPALTAPDDRALEVMERLARAARAGQPLALEGTLGQGGMAIVRLATQHSVGRKVAVKTLRDEQRTPENTARLLSEAWVTGMLEHPNVVPVYDVTIDDAGNPIIVLKRIEGVAWEEVMSDPAEIRRRFRAHDALAWNLGVLMRVCTTAHFAHTRGVVHRDLKPENVMLGEFGEVYVLDWGIAVGLGDDSGGRIPLASAVTEFAGTPAYMAPEMLDGDGVRLSPRTDVYLLGGILHQILTGRPPHGGDSLDDFVASVMASRPRLPRDTPAELARICRRAMDLDPDARFENPEQLRLALSGYLERRGALHMSERADRALERLRDDLRQGPGGGPERRLQLYSIFAECRFGYAEALAAWRDNEPARAGLAAAVEAMVDFEIAAGDGRAAAALVADLKDVPAPLAGKVAAAVAAKDAEDSRLRKLAAYHDPRAGGLTRVVLSLVMAALWVATPILAEMLPAGWETHLRLGLIPVPFIFIIVGLSYSVRDSVMRTAINRRVTASALFCMFAMIVVQGLAAELGIAPRDSIVLFFYTWFVTGAMLAVDVEWRLFPTPLGYLVGAFAAGAAPDKIFIVTVLCNLNLAINMLWVWGPRSMQRRSSAS